MFGWYHDLTARSGLVFPVCLGDHTIHIDNNGFTFLGSGGGTSGKFDVVVGILACHVADGIRIEHLTVDADGTGVFRNHDAVTFTEYGVIITARILESLVKFNGYRVGTHGDEFGDIDRVIS